MMHSEESGVINTKAWYLEAYLDSILRKGTYYFLKLNVRKRNWSHSQTSSSHVFIDTI